MGKRCPRSTRRFIHRPQDGDQKHVSADDLEPGSKHHVCQRRADGQLLRDDEGLPFRPEWVVSPIVRIAGEKVRGATCAVDLAP